jgi:hypothetical protein
MLTAGEFAPADERSVALGVLAVGDSLASGLLPGELATPPAAPARLPPVLGD